MTIIVATRSFIAADSRLSLEGGVDSPITVGKVFRRRGGGLFASAGDSRRTAHFDKSLKAGRDPEELDVLEDEAFDGVLLMPDQTLIYYDEHFAAFPFGEDHIVLGSAELVARSWLRNGADPITAIRRCIEVDRGCGYPITVAYLDGRIDLIDDTGKVTHVAPRKGKR